MERRGDETTRCLLVARPGTYRDRLVKVLDQHFAHVQSVERRYESLVHLALERYAIVVLEEKPNEPHLPEYIDLARTLQPSLAIALLASRLEIHHAVLAMRHGADDVLFRPIILSDFGPRLRGAIHRREAISARLHRAEVAATESGVDRSLAPNWDALIHTCRTRLLESAPSAAKLLGSLVHRCEQIGAQEGLVCGEWTIRTAQLWELDLAFCEARATQGPLAAELLDEASAAGCLNGDLRVLQAALTSLVQG